MTPLVSCLMVTKAGREQMAARAIEAWRAQSYPLRELIVVADNPDAFNGLPANVKVVQATRATLGGIRQQSVAAARGDLVTIWDDDDEYDPDRIATQVLALGAADACVLNRMTLVCVCGLLVVSSSRHWEPTLLARRAGLPRYRDVPHGEDEALIDDLKATGAQIVKLDAPEIYRYRFWGGNACSIEHWQDLFEAAGSTHDLWRCAAERGLAEPEGVTFEALARRIPEVTSPSALTRVASAVTAFRAMHAANGPCADQRARLALQLAAAYSAQGSLDVAKAWALRSLSDGPRADTCCVLGEIAAAEHEHAAAQGWYDAACSTSSRDSMIPALTQARAARRAELRTMVRPLRSVVRCAPGPGHVLAVMTCLGREVPLQRTLMSLNQAGLQRWAGPKLLVHDGLIETRAGLHAWTIRDFDRPLAGQASTFLSVLEYAAMEPGFTALTMFEDDVVLAKNALDYIAGTAIDPDLAVISWFTIDGMTGPPEPFLHITAAVDFRPSNAAITMPAAAVETVLRRYRPSNQAITMPADTVNKILASKRLKEWPERNGADRIFWEVPGTPCAVHYPNLVQHTGEQSMVGNAGERTSPSFIGEDANALALFDR